MNRFSSLTDAGQIVKWQVNLIHVPLLPWRRTSSRKRTLLKREQTEEQGNEVEVVLEDPV